MPLYLSDLLPFFRLIRQRFNEDRCPQVAASLTYTTLLSLVPVITIVLTVFSPFPAFGEMMTQVKIFLLTNMVPESAGKIISVYAPQFSDNAARLTAAGVALLALTAFMLMMTINNPRNLRSTGWSVRFSGCRAYPKGTRVATTRNGIPFQEVATPPCARKTVQSSP